MTHRCRFERRRRDERQESRCLRERLGCRAEGSLELTPHCGDIDGGAFGPVIDGLDELLGIDAVAVLGRHAPG